MQNQQLLIDLMSELTKKNTQTKKITQLCKQLNIPFNGDMVELMTYVLGSGLITKAISDSKKTANKTKPKEVAT